MTHGDFEVMPVGTIEAVREAAQLFRSYERHHLEHACNDEIRERTEKAERNRQMAERLEALLPEAGQ